MQHALVALQREKSSSYNILIFAISLFGCPLSWMPETVVPFAPPRLHATEYQTTCRSAISSHCLAALSAKTSAFYSSRMW